MDSSQPASRRAAPGSCEAEPGRYLDIDAIRAARPYAIAGDPRSPLQRAHERMVYSGQAHGAQRMGRSWSIGCVSLEVTQRCNLDYTACYLWEASQAVHDVPLDEVLRRVDLIRDHYGPHTDVQVSGGDPTLRARDELVAIVRHIRARDMRASLFTNGILTTRERLAELAAAGLNDVAFHVDMTQQRQGYDSELALNAIRRQYLERARGLGLGVFFNTTVIDLNFHEIPALCAFFVEHADTINLASFQLQADTGRGVLGKRGVRINQQTLRRQFARGVGRSLNFDAFDIGHARCNRYALAIVANGRVHDALDEPAWVNAVLEHTATLPGGFDRARPGHSVRRAAWHLVRAPRLLLRSAWLVVRKAWSVLPDAIRGRGRVHALAFFMHDFMDADHLECERIDSCVFTVATADGPMSMCLYNARRDQHLLQPLEMRGEHKIRFWNPLTGNLQDEKPRIDRVEHTRKTARGRAKQRLHAREEPRDKG